jgi:uncharacterized membrane protein
MAPPATLANGHMLHACTTVTGSTMWANLHLLSWLSLFPFATGWMGENHFTTAPTALYGAVLLMAAIAYYVFQQSLIRAQGQDSILKKAVGRDWKGKLSLVLYLAAIVATLRSASLAQGIFVSVALIWLIPDRRIKRLLQHDPSSRSNPQIVSQIDRRFCLSEQKRLMASKCVGQE